MGSTKPYWTIVGVYDDNKQPFTDCIQASTWQEARQKVLRKAEAVIDIGGIFPGKLTPVDISEHENVIPIRGRGHAIEVTSIVVTKREFMLPARCPSCKADTKRANALVEVNLQHRYWKAHLSHTGKDLAHERGGKSHDGDMIETCAIRCAQCSHMIWDGIYGLE